MKEKFKLNSDCCNAPMTVVGDGTMYYVCTKCNKPCDEKKEENTLPKEPIKEDKISRFELIDWTEKQRFGGGRIKTIWENDIKVEYDLQDDNRTLKVFIIDKKGKSLNERR